MGKSDKPLSPSKGKNPKSKHTMQPQWVDTNVHPVGKGMSVQPQWVDTNIHPKGKGTNVQPQWVDTNVHRQTQQYALPSYEEYHNVSIDHPAPPGHPPLGMSYDEYYWYSRGAAGDAGHQHAGNQQNQQNTAGTDSQTSSSAGQSGPRYQ